MSRVFDTSGVHVDSAFDVQDRAHRQVVARLGTARHLERLSLLVLDQD
jgi:hypothetical protein